jgi:hypothetical protein
MFNKMLSGFVNPTGEGLARAFERAGRLGFWFQVVLGSIPVILMSYNFAFAQSPSGPRAGLPVVEYLTLASLLILIFTTFWFWRYTRLAPTIADPDTRPPRSSLLGTVWTGLVVTVLGVAASLIVMIIEVAHLLFYFLSTPQGGVPVIQTTGGGGASWVSAVDMLSLLALQLTLVAELVAMVIGLWLLFRVSQSSQGEVVGDEAA